MLVVVMASAALASAAQDASAQASFVYDRELAAVARKSLRHADTDGRRPLLRDVRQLYVRCYRDQQSFERAFERRFGVPAARVIAYYAGGSEVHLRGGTCDNVRRFLGGRVTVLTAASYSVLLHEALHRQGLRDERVTNCLAIEAVRWGAEWLGLGEARALRARNLAFEFSRRYSPRVYRMGKPSCLALAGRTEWTELVR